MSFGCVLPIVLFISSHLFFSDNKSSLSGRLGSQQPTKKRMKKKLCLFPEEGQFASPRVVRSSSSRSEEKETIFQAGNAVNINRPSTEERARIPLEGIVKKHRKPHMGLLIGTIAVPVKKGNVPNRPIQRVRPCVCYYSFVTNIYAFPNYFYL